MKRFLAVLLSCFAMAGCVTMNQPEPLPTTVGRVDLDRFMGDWYVIAAVPTLADKQAYNMVQTYQRAQRGIEVVYRFNKGGPNGKEKAHTSKVMVDNPGINTDWTVRRQWPFNSDHRVLYLEPDYSVAVIGHPNRENVWILSRQADMSAPLYSDLILKLQNLGYDIGNIRRIPHS
jgi:apolipoprotein D and lipocalin family protein